jgi:hypothetical protein
VGSVQGAAWQATLLHSGLGWIELGRHGIVSLGQLDSGFAGTVGRSRYGVVSIALTRFGRQDLVSAACLVRALFGRYGLVGNGLLSQGEETLGRLVIVCRHAVVTELGSRWAGVSRSRRVRSARVRSGRSMAGTARIAERGAA